MVFLNDATLNPLYSPLEPVDILEYGKGPIYTS